MRPVQRVRKVETKEEAKPAPTVTKSANAKKKKQNNKIAVIATIIVCAVIVIGFAIAITVLAITDKGNTSSTDPNYYSAPESTTTSVSYTHLDVYKRQGKDEQVTGQLHLPCG